MVSAKPKKKKSAWPPCPCGKTAAFWRYPERATADAHIETCCEECGALNALAGDTFGSATFDWEPVEWWRYSERSGPQSKPGRDDECEAKYGSCNYFAYINGARWNKELWIYVRKEFVRLADSSGSQ